MNSIPDILQKRRKETYRKLLERFMKSLKTKNFQEKSRRQKHLAVERLKNLEGQLGLHSHPRLKHWALALALGFVTLTGGAQDRERHGKPYFKKDKTETTRQKTSSLRTQDAAAVDIFEPQATLGDPLIGDGVQYAGDFDGDGDEDLLLFSYYGPMRILPNDGTGNFGEPIDIAEFDDVDLVALGDVDGDGDLDIVVGTDAENYETPGTELTVLSNNGNNTFTQTIQVFDGFELDGDNARLIDLDLDDDMDLVLGTYTQAAGGAVSTFSNDGAGTFTLEHTLTGSSSFILGDFDDDGDQDIAIASYTFTFFTNDGAGGFSSNNVVAVDGIPFYFDRAWAGDFTGDGETDVVYAYYSTGIVMISLGASETILASTTTGDSRQLYYIGQVSDIDGDGDLDILAEQEYYNDVENIRNEGFLLLTNTSGSFAQSPLENIKTNIGETEEILMVDIDDDTDMDIIASNYYDAVVFENDGNENFTVSADDIVEVYHGFSSEFADIDGDEDLDVIIAGTSAVFENDGVGNLSLKQNISRISGSIHYAMAVGDFDDDGDPDVIFTGYDEANLVLWTNDGNGNFSEGVVSSLGTYREVYQLGTTDLDGDSDLDIVAVAYQGYGNILLTFANDGTGTFTQDQAISTGSYEIDDEMHLVDLDNDGDDDVVTGGEDGVLIFLNDAGSLSTEPAIYLTDVSGGFENIAVGDLDGDGDPDLLAFNSYDGYDAQYLLTNDGAGAFTSSPLEISTLNYGGAILADFDLDSDLDLFLGGGEDYEDEFWSNDGAGNFSLVGTLGSRSYNAIAGDVDGDGDLDLFTLEYYVGNRLIINTTNEPAATESNTITTADSLALVAVYDLLGGTSWAENTGWKTATANTWSGVTLNANKRVSGLDLTANNLSGTIPEELAQLTELESLLLADNNLIGEVPTALNQLTGIQVIDLSNNQLRSFPDLSGIASLTNLDLSNNRLRFSDLVPNVSIETFTYEPQKRFGNTVYDTIPAGDNLEISIEDLGEGTLYQWNFGSLIPGQPFNNEVSPIDGATARTYLIEGINAEKQGTYRVSATHPEVPALTLSSRNVNIMAKTDLFGTVYADGNNTALTNGEVIIFRLKDGPFVPEDTTEVDGSGNYHFADLVLGDFIILTQPDREVFPNTVQTYYEQTENYNDATVLEVRDQLEGIDIQMVFYAEPEPEPEGAILEGLVESDFLEEEIPDEEGRIDSRRKVKRAACSMRRFVSTGRGDQEGTYELYAYVESDDEGRFNFTGIPAGTYLLNIEYPGVPMNPDSDIEFVIKEDGSSQKFSVLATITEDGIEVEATEILGAPRPYLKNVKIYPNPSEGHLTAEYIVNRSVDKLKLELHSITGATLLSQPLDNARGAHQLDLDLSQLQPGTYFLMLFDASGEFRYQYKINKQ